MKKSDTNEKDLIADEFIQMLNRLKKKGLDDRLYISYVLAGVCLAGLRISLSPAEYKQRLKEYDKNTKESLKESLVSSD